MSQIEYATTIVPAAIWVARPIHIQDVQEKINDLPDKLSSGRTFLKVVAYPWGVEFDVCEEENEP